MMTGDLRPAEEESMADSEPNTTFSPERAAIAQSLRTTAIKGSSEMLTRYDPNEALWTPSEEAWNSRATAEKHAKAMQELLSLATEVQKKKAEIKAEETMLGRVSKYSG